MQGWRVHIGVLMSVAVHAASMVALSGPIPPRAPEKKPAVIELTALPPPEPPEVEPPPEPPPATPEEPPKASLNRRPVDRPAATPEPPRAEDQTIQQPQAAPLVLAGLTMSNSGIGVPVGFGVGAVSPPATTPSIAAVKTRPAPAQVHLTPVSDLSKRPNPPDLNSALARFYPSSLRNQGVEGEALIRVVLAKDGGVAQTQTLSETHPGFALACEKALRTSRWDPPIDKHGSPTMTALKYRCRFRVHL